MNYANDYAAHDGKLRVHFIAHSKETGHKSDAFLVEYDGNFTIIDGGLPDSPAAYDYLKNIYDGIKAEHPDAGKLKLNWIVSHFHVDHVCTTLKYIIPAEFIEMDKIFLPPATEMDEKYSLIGSNGDKKYRPMFEAAREKYCGSAEVTVLPFGKENILEYSVGKMKVRIFPPVGDGGKGKRLRTVVDGYYGGNEEDPHIPVAVVNSCSMWAEFRLGRHNFLFTGDTMKRTPDLYEALDEMTDTYIGEIGHVSVLKFPHHGFKRNHAFPQMKKFHAGWTVLAAHDETLTGYLKENHLRHGGKFVNCGHVTQVFETDGKKMSLTSIG